MNNTHKNNDFVYMTPDPKRRLVALYKYGQWIEVYKGEVLLVHKCHIGELQMMNFVITERPTVYKSRKAAEMGIGKQTIVIRGV